MRCFIFSTNLDFLSDHSATKAKSMKPRSCGFLILSVLLVAVFLGHYRSSAEPTSDKQALIDFISKIKHIEKRVRWDLSTPACNWTGVICDSTLSYVYELRLPGAGLVGQIPVNTLSRLSQLRVLSLRSNKLYGPLPADFGGLVSLRSLYLQNNQISGEFPVSLTKLMGLSRIDVSNNRFEGEIPASMKRMLFRTLFLNRNRFSGEIPAILDTSGLLGFDVSNNNFTGQIPETLAKFPESSFSGNLFLCGKPLPSCRSESPPLPPSPSPYPSSTPRSKAKLSTGAIVGIAVGVVVAVLIILLLLFCLFKRSRKNDKRMSPKQQHHEHVSSTEMVEAGVSSSREQVVADDVEHKLEFLDGVKDSFTLEDLLQASAEVLGKGTMGSSYKAELGKGVAVAVKRMKDVSAGKKEFETQMSLLGKLRHENVVRPIAYYYSKEEKLVISDYIATGSLAFLLHGRRSSGRGPLDWITRFKIGLTAAKGLQYLHTAAMIPHGNVKSTNILITPSFESCICDYGMNKLMGPSAMPTRITGYRAPEVQQDAKLVSFKSDVYSFGVLLMELLTGKAPIQVASLGDDGIDLPRWVQSVMKETFDADIYDPEIVVSGEETNMSEVLKVAMMCVEVVPEKRPEMGEVVRMLEMVETGVFQPPSV